MNDSSHTSSPVLIVGAGLTGLSCAVRLHEAGVPVHVIEASDGVGGRVRTDRVDGYLHDRGFQVYLSAYPEAGRLLDTDDLQLQAFEPGALVYDGKGLKRVMDVFRRPRYLLGSALSPIGSLADKLRVAMLRFRAMGSSAGEIRARKEQSTEDFLREFGFSDRMIDGFFRCFYGGIFLENELRTSSHMFEFTFKMFSEGSATLPAMGMGAIPLQLARRLPAETIRVNSPASSVTANSVTLADGEVLEGSRVVLATHAAQASKLVPSFASEAPEWRSVTNVYYAADTSPLNEAIIALNGTKGGLVNNLCVPSDVSPSYAPPGKALISVSLLGIHNDPEIPARVKKELVAWFGNDVETWTHLRTDLINHALPEQFPRPETSAEAGNSKGFLEKDGIMICGDHTTTASIEGAVISGNKTAAAILAAR